MTLNKKDESKFEVIAASLNQTSINWQEVISNVLSCFGCITGTTYFLEVKTSVLMLQSQIGIPSFLISKLSDIPVGKGMAGIAAERREPVEMCNL